MSARLILRAAKNEVCGIIKPDQRVKLNRSQEVNVLKLLMIRNWQTAGYTHIRVKERLHNRLTAEPCCYIIGSAEHAVLRHWLSLFDSAASDYLTQQARQ